MKKLIAVALTTVALVALPAAANADTQWGGKHGHHHVLKDTQWGGRHAARDTQWGG